MASAQPLLVGYGLTQALSNLANLPIIAKRAPTTADKAQLGTTWIYTTANTVYTLTSIVNNAATWTANGGGGAGVFASVTSATFVNAGTTITAGTGITSTAGDIVATAGSLRATAGNVVANNGDVIGESLVTTGDTGAPVVGNIQFSNVTDVTQGVGVLTILSTTANNGDNTGFFKIYVGVTTCWVPYFADIAP